jgi:hypothetical protein
MGTTTFHWGWTTAATLLTVLSLAAIWVIGTWAAFGSGIVDEVIIGAALLFLASVVLNQAWLPVAALNGVVIWLYFQNAPDDRMANIVQTLLILIALNLLLLAVFYARRRAVS